MLRDNLKAGSIPLSLLCTICDRDRKDKVIQEMESHKSYFNLAMLGKGTANSRILSYLGLGEVNKAVFFTVAPTAVAEKLLEDLDENLKLEEPGHGIAFMADIHEGCYRKVIHITNEEEGDTVEQPKEHELVLVIVNRGYTEEVMDVARNEGATGGTVLHARGCGLAGAEKFFGVTIQPERELIMIVVDRESSCDVMQAISDQKGRDTDAGAVSFSIPVSDVRGIGADVPEEILRKARKGVKK